MVELTKWPRLLVVGQAVTEEQANDILIRTMPSFLYTNDRAWQQQVCAVLGVEDDPKYNMPNSHAAREQLRCLDLHYMENWRIASSWIGGPKGWCSWDGTIGCANYNIGKWPTVEDVTADWLAIAAEWPFLDLRAQLVADEGDATAPAVEWLIRDGAVTTMIGPTELLRQPEEPCYISVLVRGGERGVELDRLRAAVAQVRGGARA